MHDIPEACNIATRNIMLTSGNGHAYRGASVRNN